MVKWRWILCTALLAGCALIDAASGGGDEDDEGTVVVNNVNNVTPNSPFSPVVCAWSSCPCGYTFCDPATSCVAEPACRTCKNDSHCAQGDFCTIQGVCNYCNEALFSLPDAYRSSAGVDYICEYDEFVLNPLCVLTACLP